MTSSRPATVEDRSAASPGRLLRVLPYLVVALASAHALFGTWGHWGDFVIDTGRELEWPRRLLAGEPLYSQLRYFYGPLAPYLNAGLYGLFGVQLRVLEVAGAVTGVATALTVTALARRFTGRFAAGLAGVLFVYACAFAHLDPVGIFNFVLPYTFAATYGMLAALLSLLALLAHLESGRAPPFLLSLVFLVLAALAKVEPLLPALTVHGLFLLAGLVTHTHRRLHAIGYATALLGVLLTYGCFYLQVGPPLLRDNLGGALNAGSAEYIRFVMGLRDPWVAIRLLGISLALVGGTALVGLLVARLQAPRVPRLVYLLLVAAAASVVLVATVTLHPDRLYRSLPLLAAGGALVFAVRWWRTPALRSGLLPHLLLAAFTGAACLRIFLLAVPQRYGFFMLAPALAWLVVLLFEYVPVALPAATSREAVFACATALVVGCAAVAHGITRDHQENRTLPLTGDRGTLWVDPSLSAALPLLRAIAQSPVESRLLVVPFTTVINFLLSRQGSADGMPSYLPMEFAGGYDDDAVVTRWERRPPEYVLWLHGEISEFGNHEFGVTYAKQAGRWITEHYSPMTSPGDQAVLLRWSGADATVVPVSR